MPSFKGAGTESSPFSIDSDDDGNSEVEVQRELFQGDSASTSLAASPTAKTLVLGTNGRQRHEIEDHRMVVDDLSDEEQDRWSLRGNDFTRGLGKRQRSHSLMSIGTGGGADTSNDFFSPLHSGESRKARKRRRKAEKNREMYQDRFNKLTHNPDLVPQFPGLDPLLFDPMAFLPQLHTPLVNGTFDFHYPPPFYQSQQHQRWPSFNTAPPWNVSTSTAFRKYPSIPPPLSTDAPATSTIDQHKPSSKAYQSIGVDPDNDTNGKHGLFMIPDNISKGSRLYIPTPACTLVLEQLPKQHRTVDCITSWARDACGAQPAKVLIDGPRAKALVEFHSADAARKAWGSPRLGASNLGIKPHLLKGRPREDLIKAYWYRMDEASAGVGEIEEGEIDETGEEVNALERKETKKKPRPTKQRQETHKREQERLPRDTSGSYHIIARPMRSTPALPLNTGLPPRPVKFTAIPIPTPVPTSTLDGTTRESAHKDADDMDLGSPVSPIAISFPSNGTTPSVLSPNPNHAPAAAFSFSKVPSEPRAMKNTPTEPRSFKRIAEQQKREGHIVPQQVSDVLPPAIVHPRPTTPTITCTSPEAVEAKIREQSLREQVLKSRKNDRGKGREELSSPAPVASGASNSGWEKTPSPTAAVDAVDSFIAAAVESVAPQPPKPPPMVRANTTTALQKMKAELAERERQALAELRDLQAKDRLRRDGEQWNTYASLSSQHAMRPSSKINLTGNSSEYFWPNEQTTTIVIVSDDEDDEDEAT